MGSLSCSGPVDMQHSSTVQPRGGTESSQSWKPRFTVTKNARGGERSWKAAVRSPRARPRRDACSRVSLGVSIPVNLPGGERWEVFGGQWRREYRCSCEKGSAGLTGSDNRSANNAAHPWERMRMSTSPGSRVVRGKNTFVTAQDTTERPDPLASVELCPVEGDHPALKRARAASVLS